MEFRYRYDTETGLYYLQSRYYNPDWGRFINADAIAAVTGELLSANMFAYCKNNAVNMHDATGFRPVFDSEEEEDAYRKNARDNARIKNPLQARDSKKREKSEIDSAFGKRGSKEREEKSQELHDTKRKEGSSNWNNRDYQGLVDGNYEKSHISNMQRAGLVLVGGSIIIGTIAEDFFTGGLGIADDPATLSAGGGIIITAFTH